MSDEKPVLLKRQITARVEGSYQRALTPTEAELGALLNIAHGIDVLLHHFNLTLYNNPEGEEQSCTESQ